MDNQNWDKLVNDIDLIKKAILGDFDKIGMLSRINNIECEVSSLKQFKAKMQTFFYKVLIASIVASSSSNILIEMIRNLLTSAGK